METFTKFGYFRTDEWIGIKFIIVIFTKICQHIQSFAKISHLTQRLSIVPVPSSTEIH